MSSFRRGVEEICAFMVYCEAYSHNSLAMYRDSLGQEVQEIQETFRFYLQDLWNPTNSEIILELPAFEVGTDSFSPNVGKECG